MNNENNFYNNNAPSPTDGYSAPTTAPSVPQAPMPAAVWHSENTRTADSAVPAPYVQIAPPEQPQKKEKSSTVTVSKAVLAISLAAALVLSTLMGFIGGKLAGGSSSAPSVTSSSVGSGKDSTVLYQSVTGSSASADDSYVASAVASKVLDSVVAITTESATYNSFFGQYVSEGAGSGVIISKDGYIVTNHHVIDDASKITVTLSDGKDYSAKLIADDEKTDLAIVKISATDLKPAVFGSSADVVVGEPVVAIGNPLGKLGGTVTSGIISAVDREMTVEKQTMRLLQTDASISPGNSGGGLFNARGELIGIVNAKSGGEYVEGLGFAIPSDTAKTIVEQLMAFGYVQGRVYMGVSLVDINDKYAAASYRVTAFGVYVMSVEEGSPAEKAGLQSGDRLTAMDDLEFTTTAELTEILDSHSVGDTVKVSFVRDRKLMDTKLTLGEFAKK